MKKLFLLIPAFLLSIAINATILDIAPNSPQASDNVRREIRDHINSGDTLRLADGTYSEAEVIELNKSVTIIAAEGAHPIIAQHYYSKVFGGADVKFIGIKFDGSLYNNGAGANDHCFYPYDNTVGNELHFENCEFTGFKSYVLYNGGSYSLDSLIINNCYFHDNTKSSVIFFNKHNTEGSQSVKGAHITNSTFANNATSADYSVIYIMNQTQTAIADVELLVDHCTFYNNPVTNTDHSSIRSYKSTKATISNCIFAHPSEIAFRATCLYGGTISNCLTYNLTYDSYKNGHRTDGGAPTLTNNFSANPLFTDAANGDFTLKMGSPARGAATDASAIGDPRWAGIIPIVTDFSSPLVLEAVDATKNTYYSLDANNYLKSANPDPVTTEYGIAEWQIHTNTPASVQATLNMYSESLYGHTYKVAIYNSNLEKIGEVGESGWSDAKTDIQLTGAIYFPEAGDYTIQLSNICNGSVATIQGITLSYYGGAVQDIPGTLTAANAVFSDKGSRADGMISFSTYADQWIKWNASTSGSGAQTYAVTLNINNPTAYGHRFTVSFYLNENESPIASVTESAWNETYGEPLAINLGEAILAGGNTYVVKVTNAEKGAQPKIISVGLVAAGGAVQNIPGTITLSDAIRSSHAFIDGDGLHFADDGHLSQVPTQWAKWNIHATDGIYSFKFDVASTNYGQYVITILDANDNQVYTHQYNKEGDGSYTTEGFLLMNGDYTLKMQNLQEHSKGCITSIVVTAEENVFIIDDKAIDAAYINAMNGQKKKIVLNRTFKGGMYNTICLPFTDWLSSVKAIFGGDEVELLELSSAELDGNTLNLIFTTPTELGHGRPYLIKPTHDVANPMWTNDGGRTINSATGYNTQSCTNADFIGSFIKSEVPAGENNLFLGPNDLLYFSQTATPIKGTRAYFQLKGISHPQQAIKHARIVKGTQVITEIDLVKDVKNASIKTIENGQLVIIRDGIRYNAMGIRLQ